MQILFILGIIFCSFAGIYLTCFFIAISDNDLKLLNSCKLRTKVILIILLPLTSILTIIFSTIYIYSVNNSFLITFACLFSLVLMCIIIYSIDCLCINYFTIIFVLLGFYAIITLFFSFDSITIDETEVTKEIILYDTDIVNENYSILGISRENFSQEEDTYIYLQYDKNDIDDELSPKISVDEIKLTDSENCKLAISRVDQTFCNYLYYHGFTIFKPETKIKSFSTKYILYINDKSLLATNNK